MTKVLVTDNHLTNIANAIRNKKGTNSKYKPNEMANAIDSIETGVNPTGTIEITENGDYDVTSYANATVNIETGGEGTVVPYAPRFITFQGYKGTDLDYEVANLDTKNITSMKNMFTECTKLESLDVSNFDTRNVTDISYFLYFGSSGAVLSSFKATNLDLRNCTTMERFMYTNQKIENMDLSGWKFESKINMKEAFYNTSRLQSLDLSSWIGLKVSSLYGTFENCSSLKTLKLPYIDTSECTTFNSLFYKNKFTNIDVSTFDLSSVTNCGSMFYGCTNLTDLDLSNWQPTKVVSLTYMFYGCSALTTLKLWNVPVSEEVTTLKQMFYECKKLTSIDMSWLTGSNITTVETIFSNCSRLESIDLSNFNTTKSINCSSMFSYCTALKHLDMRSFDFSKVSTKTSMFSYVPTDCEIIVADDTQKDWFATNFSTLTNVKTVAELEAEA